MNTPEKEWASIHDEMLSALKGKFEEGHELALYDAIELCHKRHLAPPTWVMASTAELVRNLALGTTPKKKLGRHSRPAERQKQLLFDALCLEWVKDLRKGHGLAWVKAFEEAGKALKVSAETVRKAYSRATARRAKKDFYYSEIIGRAG